MKAALTGALMLAFCGLPANAEFYTFAEWERLPPAAQSTYVSGAIDSMFYFAVDEYSKETAERQFACLKRSKITNGQIVETVRSLALKDPSFRGGNVQKAIVEAFARICPDLLGAEAFESIFQAVIKREADKK